MTNRNLSLLMGLISISGAIALAPVEARACDTPPDWFIGVPASLDDDDESAVRELPRNVAFLLEELTDEELAEPVVVERSDDESLELLLEPISGPIPLGSRTGRLYRSAELLSEGTQVSGVRVGDYVDDLAPTAPKVIGGDVEFESGSSGCAQNSCGDATTLNVAFERGSDDRQPARSLVYSVYVGTSPENAKNESIPLRLTRAYDRGDGNAGFSLYVDKKWSESNTFVCLSAVDAAGNESPRSEPFRINTDSGACAFRGPSRGGALQLVVFVAAAGAVFARRASRRPAHR